MNDVEREIQRERDIAANVRYLAKELAEAASPVWMWGDGCGGWVRQVIEEAFDAEGLARHRAPGGSAKRPLLSIDLRARVFARDGMRCQACGGTDDLTVDHIVPVLSGGGDEIDNLQTLCRSCNSKKGAR